MIDPVFRRILRFSFRRRGVVLTVAALVSALAMALAARLRFDADVLNLLPRQGPAVRSLQVYLRDFGNPDRLLVMFEAPADHVISEYRDSVDALVQAMRRLTDLGSVDDGLSAAGVDWSYVLDRQLILLGPTHIDEAFARFDPESMDRALARARDRLTLAPSALARLVREDPFDLLSLVRGQLTDNAIPIGIEPGEDGYVSRDGRARLVIARPIHPPYDTAFSRKLNASLDAVWSGSRAAVMAANLPPLTITEAGGYRASAEAEDLIRREGTLNGALTLACIVAIVVVAFRSVRPLVAVLVPMLLASLATIALWGVFRPLSMVAAGSVAILFGLGEDGGTLMYVSYIQQRRRGLDGEAAAASLSRVAISMTIGFATTAATFLGLAPIDFPALQEMGVLIGAGILACGAFTILLLPALLPRRPPATQLRAFQADAFARGVRKYRRPILAGSAAATILLGVAALRLRVVPTVDKLDAHTPARETGRAIARRFELSDDVVFVIGEGTALEPLLDANQRLKDALGAGISASWPVDFLPPAARQTATAERLRAARVDPARVRAALERAGARAGFRPDTFAPFLTRLPRLLDMERRLTLDDYRTHGLAPIVSRYVSSHDGLFRTVAYVSPRTPADIQRVEAATRELRGPLRVTGIPIVNAELKEGFQAEFLKGAAIGTVGVTCLLFVGFRRAAPTLLALGTTALGMVWSVGLLAMADVELDLFSLFAVLMSVGVGVDYAVHFLHRREIDAQRSATVALSETGPAILLAAATTIIGFGSLVTSSYGPLRALGLVSALSITTCLLASIVVLPAWLSDRP